MRFNNIGNDFLHLVGACSVAHCNQLNLIVLNRFEERCFCLLRFVLVNHKGAEVLAGFVEGGTFGSGSDTGVYAEHAGALNRLRHQEVF